MKCGWFLVLLLLIFSAEKSAANERSGKPVHPVVQFSFRIDTLSPDSLVIAPVDPGKMTKDPPAENKRLIAAILAFPVPFGITGLHRIYLGTSPWIPIVYFVTLGGCGMLPLLDFIFILTATDEELETFANNSKVFMWVK